jgi:hypothetical protein
MGLLLAMGTARSLAQSTGADPARPRDPIPSIQLQQVVTVPARQLTLKLGIDRAAAAPGEPLVLVADVTPQADIHVYAPGATGYLPIELNVQSPAVEITEPPRYPPAEHRFLPAINEAADVYESHFQIQQPVTLTAAASAGDRPLSITGILKYQACNETVCFRPETVRLSWRVPVGK